MKRFIILFTTWNIIFSCGCTPTIYTSERKNISIGSYIVLPHEELELVKVNDSSAYLKSKYRDLVLRKTDDVGENMGESIRLKLISTDRNSALISISRLKGGFMFP